MVWSREKFTRDVVISDVLLIHRLFHWEDIMSREDNQAGESEEVIKELRDVGQQLALAFNPEGSVLAAGAEVKKGSLMQSLFNNRDIKRLVVLMHFVLMQYRMGL